MRTLTVRQNSQPLALLVNRQFDDYSVFHMDG
jgi:hypothetical protein